MIAFSTIDWWIVGVYVLAATIPGFLCRKFIQGQSDFLVAGRTLSVFLATATLTATEMGLITVMYWSQFGFEKGLAGMSMGVIAFLATLFVGSTGFMVKGLRQSGATTVAEFYELRYSRGVRLFGGIIIAVAGVLNYGVFLRVEAEFIKIVTDIPDFELRLSSDEEIVGVDHAPDVETAGALSSSSEPAGDISAAASSDSDTTGISSTAGSSGASDGRIHISSIKVIMTVLVVVVLLYTLMGGMVSVALTDYIQFIVLTIGLGATTWWVLNHPDVGGFSGILAAVEKHRPGYGLDPTKTTVLPDGTVLGLGVAWLVWQTFHWLGTNTWQPGAFRTAAADSPQTARVMWTLTAFNYFGRAIIPMLWGAAALAYLSSHNAVIPTESGETMKAMPLFLKHLPTGLIGLLMAGMLAALMSTHSSYLLTWSGVLTEDIVAPVVRAVTGYEMPATLRLWITRFLIICLGAFLLGFGLWFEIKGTIWGYLAVTGTMYVAGSLTLVAFGLHWRKAGNLGAYLGLIGGAAPGLVYLTLRISTQITTEAGTDVTWLINANNWMTDPRTGIISFVLAGVGMIVGTLSGRSMGGDSQPATTAPAGPAGGAA